MRLVIFYSANTMYLRWPLSSVKIGPMLHWAEIGINTIPCATNLVTVDPEIILVTEVPTELDEA